MRRNLFIFLAAFAVGQAAATAQITVNYNAGNGLRDVVDGFGVPLPDGNLVEIGYFTPGFNVSANASDLQALSGAWHLFDTTLIRHIPPIGTPEPGRFAGSATSTDTQFNSQKISLWIFKTSDNAAPSSGFGNVLEYGLFSSTLGNWVFPNQGATPPADTTTISSSDADQFYYGGFIAGSPGSLQLAAVPEPQFYALATGLGMLVFAGCRQLRRETTFWNQPSLVQAH